MTYELLGFVEKAPKLVSVGPFALPSDLEKKTGDYRAQLLENGGYSERQAVATDSSPNLNSTTFKYFDAEYATIAYLRKFCSQNVATLTAGALLCAPQSSRLFLEQRSKSASVSAGKLSMFGGHFCLDQEDLGYGALVDTMIHEVMQEANTDLREICDLKPENLPPQAVIKEKTTGSLQYTPLCFALTEEQADLISADQSEEGNLVTVDLNNSDKQIFQKDSWSVMGWGVFKTWIDAGCPVQKNWQGPSVNIDKF